MFTDPERQPAGASCPKAVLILPWKSGPHKPTAGKRFAIAQDTVQGRTQLSRTSSICLCIKRRPRIFPSLSKFSFMLITKRSSNDLLSLKQKAVRHNKNNKPHVPSRPSDTYGSFQPFHSSYNKPWNAVIFKKCFFNILQSVWNKVAPNCDLTLKCLHISNKISI